MNYTLPDGSRVDCMTNAELADADRVSPTDVIDSLAFYALKGGDINPTSYDQAIARAMPPFTQNELEEVIGLCVKGIALNHFPKNPHDYERTPRQHVAANPTQYHFAALAGATSMRIAASE